MRSVCGADYKDLRKIYDVSKHADVRAGRKSEEQVLGEFLVEVEDRLLSEGRAPDHPVSWPEFVQCFEFLVTNTWPAKQEPFPIKGWAQRQQEARDA